MPLHVCVHNAPGASLLCAHKGAGKCPLTTTLGACRKPWHSASSVISITSGRSEGEPEPWGNSHGTQQGVSQYGVADLNAEVVSMPITMHMQLEVKQAADKACHINRQYTYTVVEVRGHRSVQHVHSMPHRVPCRAERPMSQRYSVPAWRRDCPDPMIHCSASSLFFGGHT